MGTKFIKDKIAFLLLRKKTILPLLIFSYIVFELFFVLPLPIVGIHSWNESVYLSLAKYMQEGGNPFVFKAAFDPFRPDYNVGYLFFWASYIFHYIPNVIFEYTSETFLLISRVFSLVATLVSSFFIYKIAMKLSKNEWCAYVAAIGFLFSPLILYFGTKFQLEPFALAVFLFSWLLTIKYAETGKYRYGIFAFIILGALIATRQIFAIYIPAFLLTTSRITKRQQQKNAGIKSIFSILTLFLGFLSPIMLTQLMVPEYSPLKFQFLRLMESPTLASTHYGQTENLIIQYFENSLMSSLGLIFLFVPVMIIILAYERKINIEILAFLFGGSIYFIFAFRHNIGHMYHNYYFLPIIILSLVFVTKFVLEKRRKAFATFFSIFFICSIIFSIWQTTNVYGVSSSRIYREIDCYGNLDSVFAGQFINRFHQVNEKNGLLDQNITYYSLVQSPAVYFYEEIPTISYYDFYKWDAINKEYEGFNYFTNQESFSIALQKRNVFVLTITPDVYQHQEQTFQRYIQDNFAFIGSEGVYDFYLNQTIFNKDPKFCKNQAFLILENLENSHIAPAEVCQSVMNLSNWYRITKRTESLNEVVINEYPQNFSIENKKLNNRTVTVEISLINKIIPQMETIVSLDDAVNIRYGDSRDIYLELFSVDGYRWISGVDVSKFSWQRLKLTFVYDVDALRAEIYINGILMSNTLKGVNGTSFSPISLSYKNFIKTHLYSNATEIYSIEVWNRALSENEIKAKEKIGSGSVFSLDTPDVQTIKKSA